MDGEIETFSRGSKRMEYAFGTQELAESIVQIRLTPYNFAVSGHRGLFIDLFYIDAFLVDDTSHLLSPMVRGIKSNSLERCRKCVEALTKYLTGHQVFARATQAQNQMEMYGLTTQLARTWERINRDLQDLVTNLHGIQSCATLR